MACIYSTEYAPDPTSARDVLAFILCPIKVFAVTTDVRELEAIAELIGPAKAEAVRRWYETHRARVTN